VSDVVAEACAVVRARLPSFKAEVAIVLGSGLGGLVDLLKHPATIDYGELPGFPRPTVAGHGGRLHLGTVAGRGVLMCQGRAHYYEGGRADAMAVPVGLTAAFGAQCLILTNAAGSLRPDAGPGSLMLITDHINLTGANPLVGGGDGPAFIDMSAVYDLGLRAGLEQAADRVGVGLHQGVYMWFSGPSFETPAEIRAARTLGADAVGMSTVPEAILARAAGLRVAAISNITNLAAGMDDEVLSHAGTLAGAVKGAEDLQRILADFLAAENPSEVS